MASPLREVRLAAGLSCEAVARAVGTTRANVAAYERGDKATRAITASRIHAAVRCGAHSPIHRNRLQTVAATAATIRRGLRQGWQTPDLLRAVREMRSNAQYLTTDADRQAFWFEPSTTRDDRWDALLAGVVAWDHLRMGDEEPAWTRRRSLDRLWFVGSIARLHVADLVATPPSLAVRGVIIDPDSLGSV
jgi:transcriptional regulator with XRE-family HTH domain